MAIAFVGAAGGGASAAGGTLPLTSLSGGLSSSAAIGDVVVVAVSVVNSSDLTISLTNSGYTKVGELYANDTWDTNFAVFVKKLTTAETSVTSSFGSSSPFSMAVSVWRGVADVILDVSSTSATGINNGEPNAPSITTVTNDSVVLALGGAAGSRTGSAMLDPLAAPSGMGNFISGYYVTAAGTGTTSAVGIAALARPSAGSYDPPVFGGGRGNVDNSWAAYTIALRPFATATNVSAALPSFTVTAPASSVTGKAAVSGALPSVSIAAPMGTATGRAAVSEALPGIILTPPAAVVGLATLVSVPLPGFSVTAPAVTVTAGAAISGDLPGVTLSPPAATITLVQNVFADLPSLAVSAPSAAAGPAIITPASRIITFASNRLTDRTITFGPNRVEDRIITFT